MLRARRKNVLHEDKNVRQIDGDPFRRWFSDEFFDLIVWFEADNSVRGFQLCYDPNGRPRALTWRKDGGYTHNAIDDGDISPGGHKSSPILVPDGMFESGSIASRFEAAAEKLPADIRELVLSKILDFGKNK